MPETKEVGVRPHRRPVYQPKAQAGVTNFQPLLKGTTTPDSAANTGKGKQEEELIAEDNGNDEERVEHDDKSKHEEEHEVELVEKKASSEALVEDFLDPDFCVYVPRDYSGMEVAYQREFPKELEGVVRHSNFHMFSSKFFCHNFSMRIIKRFDLQITEEQFQYTIDTVNEMLHSAQKLSCLSCLGSLVAYMTCTLIYLCKKTRMEKVIK